MPRATDRFADIGHTHEMNEKKMMWLQALRGVAAMMVVFFHMRPYWTWVPSLEAHASWMRWGFSGVDVFFVISGFVVYRSAKASIPVHGVLSFWRKRAARIYLMYWPVFLIFAAVSVFVANSPPKSTGQVIRSFFLLQPTMFDHWMTVAWSLTNELYYYLLLGVVFLLPRRAWLAGFIALAGIFVAWNLGWLLWAPGRLITAQQPLEFWLNAMALEFLAGVFLAMVHETFQARVSRAGAAALAALGATLTVGGFYVGGQSELNNQIAILRAATYGLAGLGLVIVALALEHAPRSPPRWLLLLGDSSYSLYLLHVIVIERFASPLYAHFVGQTAWMTAGLVAMPLLVVATGCLWHLLVEVRLIRLARKA